MIRFFKGLSCFAALSMLAAACTTTPDGADTSNDELRVRPGDSENQARLTLSLPTGSCLPGGNCSRPLSGTFAATIDGVAVSLGVSTRLKPGAHTIGVNGSETTVTLGARQVRNYVFAVARSKCTADALGSVPATDFGKSVEVSNAACPIVAIGVTVTPQTLENVWMAVDVPVGPLCKTNWFILRSDYKCQILRNQIIAKISISNSKPLAFPGNGASCSFNGAVIFSSSATDAERECNELKSGDWASTFGGAARSLPPGYFLPAIGSVFSATDTAFVADTYSVDVGGVAQSFTLAEGNISEIPIRLGAVGAVPNTFATNITFADVAELPSAPSVWGRYAATVESNCRADRTYMLPVNSVRTPLKLKAFVDSACTYTLSVAGREQILNQSAPNAITLHRLDVDDVTVTREDGSTYLAHGTYEVFFGGNRVVRAETNSGIDMLPGTYELVISYQTVDGAKTQRQTLTF
jgi:hypothetical protein